MPNYKEMYLKLFYAAEQAVNLLISAQRECEEMYIADSESEIQFLELSTQKRNRADEA